jgi:nitrate/TMAO reductase-like tetraheme cytochrome c subunit
MKRFSLVLNSGKVATLLAVGASFLLQVANVSADEAKDFKNIGSAKCKMCHKKESVGAQYLKWQESSHSQAYETLGTPEAAAYAKERGIEGSPQEAAECMKCHSTAWGMSAEELTASKITLKEGVSCESCHGAGSAYWKKKTMEKITAGTLDGATVGLITPDKTVCISCHNDESPGFKGFDFDEFQAKIAHPMPKKDSE